MKSSILQEELLRILERVGEPKMLRPDRGTLHAQDLLEEIETMEREGLLRSDGAGALIFYHPPCKEGTADIFQALFNLGVVPKSLADRLRDRGWEQPKPETMS